MSQFVVAVFEDAAGAQGGLLALERLEAEGSVTLYGRAVVDRGANGNLAIEQWRDRGPLGLGVGALVGGLVEYFGGLRDSIVVWVASGAPGTWREYLDTQASGDFVGPIARELCSGKSAVIVEVSEEGSTPIDRRFEALGGVVMRQPRDATLRGPSGDCGAFASAL
jgi:uncharacterized membrane protein